MNVLGVTGSRPSPGRFPGLPCCWRFEMRACSYDPPVAFFPLPSILSSGDSPRMKPTTSTVQSSSMYWLTANQESSFQIYTCRHNQVLKFKSLQRQIKPSAHWRTHARNRHGPSRPASSAAVLESFLHRCHVPPSYTLSYSPPPPTGMSWLTILRPWYSIHTVPLPTFRQVSLYGQT